MTLASTARCPLQGALFAGVAVLAAAAYVHRRRAQATVQMNADALRRAERDGKVKLTQG
jgi:hypothetical protein